MVLTVQEYEHKMPLNIPNSDRKRVVIVGGGFGGLKLAQQLKKSKYQVVLIDKHNFHQFQPLFYQVAMSGLEPSSIAFPLRKLFQKTAHIHIRVAEALAVNSQTKRLDTNEGEIWYDYLILAMGADTNFYGMKEMEDNSMTLKSISEALYLRNHVLNDYERALKSKDIDDRQKYLDIAIVGGGATGVELAGSLAEMRKFILPKEYPEFDYKEVDIYLIQSNDRLLPGMSEKSSKKALQYLEALEVQVELNSRVVGFSDNKLRLKDGRNFSCGKVIWAAGIAANRINGIPETCIGPGGRLKVNNYNELVGVEDIFVIGDQCIMASEAKPYGDPQVAQVAIQQGQLLHKNLANIMNGKPMRPFSYKDKGMLATVGRNKAVADLPKFHFGGYFAWLIWLVVHLFALIGTKNKVFVFLNWTWNYLTYDQSLRLIIKPFRKE